MKHIMLDLETMGTAPNAAIVAIGAVPFNALGVFQNYSFYKTIALSSAVNWGGVIDPKTVTWWLQQNDAARNELVSAEGDMFDALREFSTWLHQFEPCCVWGNGSDFDNVILSNAYLRNELKIPWDYRNNRCYRTFSNMMPHVTKTPFMGVRHRAIDDAVYQAMHAADLLKTLA